MSMAALGFGLKLKYWKVIEIIVRDTLLLEASALCFNSKYLIVQLEGNISVPQNLMCPTGDIPAWTITQAVAMQSYAYAFTDKCG